jgi:dipeptidase E
VPLDAPVRAGRPHAVAARDGLRGTERREHSDGPRIGEDFVRWRPPTGGDDSTLGVVGFSIFPHLDHEIAAGEHMADAERWAAGIPGPAYAIDDDTAIRVTDGSVEVVSVGHWRLFPS